MKTDLNLIKIQRDQKQQRQFFVGFGLALVAFGGWSLYRQKIAQGSILLAVGLFLIGAELFLPKVAVALFKGWMAFAQVLGRINTFILLSLIYYLLLWPIAALRQLFTRKQEPIEETYKKRHSSWEALTQNTYGPERYYRPF